MPAFLASLLGGLVEALGTITGRVLLSLGIGYVSYSGLDTSLDWVRTQIAASFGQLGAQSLAVLSAAGVGSAVSIVLSALSVRLVVDGLTSGAVKKMVVK